MPSRAIRSLAIALVALAALVAARPAAAQPTLLKRSVENMLMGPLDAIVAPYTAWVTLQHNMPADTSTGGKVATSVIGVPYNWGTYIVLGGFRFAAGVFGIPIGLVLWPVNEFHEVRLGSLFDTSEAGALVDVETPVLDFKFGGRWLTAR
ncbi:MAG TPA: hypothetical protein VNO26_02140 [Candidatus Limnocylindria bacterium]|nr:hypothetical protein [Candidatus Limnocylindria bacterium]